MLYITTRNQNDAYTAHKALTENYATDGGRFVPFRLAAFSAEEMARLTELPFNGILAEVLNVFFSAKLQSIDVEFCIGKIIAKLIPMNHKIVVAEVWHNLDRSFAYVEKRLYEKLTGTINEPTYWARIAIRTAVLFALYGDMLRTELIQPSATFDVSVPDDYFLTAAAALYAQKMGLPIRTVVCTCQQNGTLWDFVHRGEVNTAAVAAGIVPELERLIQQTLGFDELKRFCEVCERGKSFILDEENLQILNKGLFCSVVGADRAKKTINSVYRSNAYILDCKTASCYSSLQDYRSKTGESGLTLLLSETTPAASVKEISEATGLSAEQLLRS
ncbi:MAG: hypothetical protein J6Q54_01165 [Oscillospiraceae bacterium]|nr:hypothetical protein [Oscillospiraceae bacterium]